MLNPATVYHYDLHWKANPDTIYSNVWLADHPRPASLGSALRER